MTTYRRSKAPDLDPGALRDHPRGVRHHEDPAGRRLPGSPRRARQPGGVQRLQSGTRARQADPRAVRDLRHRSVPGRSRNVVPNVAPGQRAARRADPHDAGVVDLRPHDRDHRWPPARHRRGVQAELVRRRRGHGRRQRRRVDPDLRARPAAGLRVRQPPEGHAVRPAAVRAPHARCLDRPARRALGPRGPAGARCGPSWTSFRTCTR